MRRAGAAGGLEAGTGAHPLPERLQIGLSRPQQHRILTRIRHGRHSVQAVLEGPNGKPVSVSLILDTGATTIALPASMMAALGFSDNNLSPGRTRTAGGTVNARSGRLAAVSIGSARAKDVEIIFIDDRTFGRSSKGLLGMSFLKHFQMTVSNDPAHIVLVPKRS
ncbi:MAG: clan AA aspartic protease [Defluviicoccus sp.]|nr:MAG: clan AA aspartic protease [Defluviicoccus sp.]